MVCVCERERVDVIFDLVPLDEVLRWSLCWTAAGAAEGLQRRESALVCSVRTADSNAAIDTGWRLGSKPGL